MATEAIHIEHKPTVCLRTCIKRFTDLALIDWATMNGEFRLFCLTSFPKIKLTLGYITAFGRNLRLIISVNGFRLMLKIVPQP